MAGSFFALGPVTLMIVPIPQYYLVGNLNAENLIRRLDGSRFVVSLPCSKPFR